ICWYKVAKARLAKSKSVDGPVEEAANKAISGFDQYMAYIDKHKASGKEAKEKRDELLAKVVYFRASLSDKLGKGQEVMDTLKGFEKKYAKTGSASLIGAAIWLRLKTLVNRAEEAGEQKNEAKQQKLLDDANNELRLLSKAARGSRHVQFGHMRIGFTYDKMSKKYKKGDPQRDALTEKAAGHLYVWARNYGPISYKLLKYVAVKIFLLAGEDNSKYLNQAAVLFGRLLKDFPKQAKKDQIAAHVAKCYLLTGRFAQSISVLRQEYAVNPRSGFAIRGLGRAYFEVASKPSGSRSAYRSLILNAAEEDLALTRHTKNKDMMRYMVQRGSVLYEAKERLRKKKPMWNMSNEKYDAFQRSELAKPVKARVKFFRKLVDNYYTRLQNRLKGMRAGAEIKSAAGVFGFDRCRYYFRTAARKTVKLSPKWWDAKYYIIKSFVREGQLRQDYADRIDGPEKKLNKRLANQQKKLAKRLWNNLSTLYSDFSNPENKKRFSDLREDIQNALQGG
ncbi:hypothetical protein JYT84_00465, partial [bacterium AH-315-M10]|nr:hypothetical protein [bacterium AH-315-M10]